MGTYVALGAGFFWEPRGLNQKMVGRLCLSVCDLGGSAPKPPGFSEAWHRLSDGFSENSGSADELAGLSARREPSRRTGRGIKRGPMTVADNRHGPPIASAAARLSLGEVGSPQSLPPFHQAGRTLARPGAGSKGHPGQGLRRGITLPGQPSGVGLCGDAT
jgi:hypothetical protein